MSDLKAFFLPGMMRQMPPATVPTVVNAQLGFVAAAIALPAPIAHRLCFFFGKAHFAVFGTTRQQRRRVVGLFHGVFLFLRHLAATVLF